MPLTLLVSSPGSGLLLLQKDHARTLRDVNLHRRRGRRFDGFPRRDRQTDGQCIPSGSDISHAVDGLGPAAEDGAELRERWKIVG